MTTKIQGLAFCLALVAVIALSGCAKRTGSDVTGDDTGETTGSTTGGTTEGDFTSGTTTGTSGGSGTTNISFSPIYFEFDQSTLTSRARETLRDYANILSQNRKLKVIVEGHCDNRGTEEYNLALGEKRAKTIRDYLVNLGVQGPRVSIISYGEERPASSGETETAWSKNRRGEFSIGTY